MSKPENNLSKLAEQLVNLPVKEVNELAKILKEEHGIEPAAAPVAMAAPVAEEKKEEKKDFEVKLKDLGSSKIAVIRALKEQLGVGLAEAKGLAEGAPGSSLTSKPVPKAKAEEIKKALETAGASVEIA